MRVPPPTSLPVAALAAIGLLWCGAAAGPPLAAQAPPPPPSAAQITDTYKEGMAAFSAGEYRKAAEAMKAVIARAADDPALESVHYTLGAALYNVPDYPEAIKALNAYRAKFPRGARLPDASLALAQAFVATKNYPEANKLLPALEAVPALRERALLLGADAFKAQGKPDDAIAALRRLVGPDPRTPASAQGALLLVAALAEKGDASAAAALLAQFSARTALVNNALQFNATTVELGDRLQKANQFQPALACYRLVRPRERVIENQQARAAAAARAVQANLDAIRANPAQVTELAGAGADLRADLEAAKAQLAEAEKLPPRYDAALHLRMARCFSELDRKWESVVIYRDLVDRTPAGEPEREPAYYGWVTALSEVAPAEEIRQACADYLKEFPQGPNANAVGYLSGASALQTQDLDAAAGEFGRMLEAQPQSPFREQMLYGLANARFLQGKYDEALATYGRYEQAYPKGVFAEEVLYRTALARMLTNKPDDARQGFEGYASQYPQGVYLSDVRYRQAMLRFAAEQFPETLAACESWEQRYGENTQLGEVLSLKGDTLAALDRADDAIAAYARAAKIAATDEVAQYTLGEATKLLQRAGRWEQISALCQEFVQARAESPVALLALSWIAKAKAREGKVAEARAFLAGTVKKHLADPKREAVEPMLAQLAQLCLKRPPAAPAASPADAAAPAPTPPAFDPEKELAALLAPAGESGAPAPARARVLYARAELARLRKKPAEQDAALQAIAERFQPEDLSQALLAQIGDFLLAKGQRDRAAALFQRLMDEHPKGDYVDFAYNGLGELAFQKKDYPAALRFFTDATEKIAAAQKLKDVTVGRAKTLLALGRLDEARKGFLQIASVREWRGEATAFSTYSLGEIEKRQDRWAEAHAHFQRVYVVYGRYLPWVARAYLEAADCLEKLGKSPEAVATLREMLRNAKLADLAEAREARERLQKLGAG